MTLKQSIFCASLLTLAVSGCTESKSSETSSKLPKTKEVSKNSNAALAKEGVKNSNSLAAKPSAQSKNPVTNQLRQTPLKALGITDEETQKIIMARFKNTRELRAKVQETSMLLTMALRMSPANEKNLEGAVNDYQEAIKKYAALKRENEVELSKSIGNKMNSRIRGVLLATGLIGEPSPALPYDITPETQSASGGCCGVDN